MLKLKLKEKEEPSIKISLGKPVKIKLKANRTQVEGYDAEAPDREEDPTVEEAIVLRMLPGLPAVEKLHKACETNDFSTIQLKWEERRKAIVVVDGEEFHAQLLDLPTITEIHKTVDRRNIFKTTSVSQILLVTHKVGTPPPDMRPITQLTTDPQSYPHGLTPPMHNVKNRRFQKRMSNKAIESIESKVDELLKRDAEAKEVQTELLPASAVAAQQALAEAARAAARARAEESDMEVDDELDEEFERAMLEGGDADGDGQDEGGQDGENGGDAAMSSDDDDDDDDDDDEEERQPGMQDDEDEDDARQHGKRLREEVKELQATIEAKERVARTVVNDIMRARHMDAVNRLRSELDKKQSMLHEADANVNTKAPEEEEEEEEEEDDDDDDEDSVMPMAAPDLPEAKENVVEEPEEEQFAGLGERLEDALRDGIDVEDDDIDSLF